MTNDGLANVVAGLGTERDKASYTHYQFTTPITEAELDSMYRSSWLSKRIVNAVADDMTREWRQHVFDSKAAKDQEAIENLEKRLQVQSKVNQAIRWARLYGGGVIILGLKGNVDQLALPLNVETVRQGDLQWLHVADRHRVSGSGQLVDDISSPYYGTPKEYILAELTKTVRIHHTRVIRFEGQKLPWKLFLQNAAWHDSELAHIYTSIRNNDTVSAAISTMLFESNVDVITVQDLNTLLAQECGDSLVVKRFQLASLMKSFNRTLVLDGTETYEKKSNNFSNLDKIWERFMADVCGSADIPMTRLFGQSAGGLNATGDNDIRNYYDMLSAKQESDVRPQLEYLDQVLVRSALGHMPPTYQWDFKSLWQLSDTEVATVQKTRADRDNIYLTTGVVTEGLVARELKEDGTYKNMTEEDVAMAEELALAPEEEPEVTTPAVEPAVINEEE